jgi:hypothetical protein
VLCSARGDQCYPPTGSGAFLHGRSIDALLEDVLESLCARASTFDQANSHGTRTWLDSVVLVDQHAYEPVTIA